MTFVRVTKVLSSSLPSPSSSHASLLSTSIPLCSSMLASPAFFSAMINCFVHVVMYTYYLLSALGPRVRKYLWWKKYLTGMQLVSDNHHKQIVLNDSLFVHLQMQFVILLIHVTQSLYNGCAYDWRPQWALFFYLLSHIALFSNFYRHAYIKPKGTSDGGSDAALQKKARQKKEQ